MGKREDGQPTTRELTIDPGQSRVAAVVSQSKADIPAGFAVVRVTVDRALAHARAASRRLRALIGLPELTVKTMADLCSYFPQCFVTTAEERPGPQARVANVGVSLDVGTGLQVPVIHNADQLSLGDIGGLLLRYRQTAMRGSFRTAQLAGATIMLAFGQDATLCAQPIIYPGLACAVSLGGVAVEPWWDETAQRVISQRVTYAGLVYDGRVLSDHDAVQFLLALKRILESPSSLG